MEPTSEYPAWRYHFSLPARIVHTVDEDQALGEGWHDSPAKTQPDPAGTLLEPSVVPTPRPRRRRQS